MAIFVAGTGRCGTSQLTRVLGEHPRVFTLGETRFLVDAGGLEDLVHTLTAAYTPFHAEDALSRFRTVLTERVTGADKKSAFRIFDLPGKLGRERYADWVQRFLADLTWYSFDEIVYDDDWETPLAHVPRNVGRYFPVREELIALCRRYIDDLFSAAAHDHGKRIWCEKTPYNLLSMGFLWELFPTAKIIHIVRHPVAVAASHLTQGWAPSDIESVCSWLESVYRRWLDFRQGLELDSRYIEIRLEDLAADWPRQRATLFDRIDLPDVETPTSIDIQRTGQNFPLSAGQESVAVQRLRFAIDAFGYPAQPTRHGWSPGAIGGAELPE